MSRDLKLRVWDHKHKTMGRVIGWSRYELMEEVGNVVYYVGDKTSLQPTDSDRIEIMQSTGLFDKNGKEIFEGDIVLLSDSVYPSVVAFSEEFFGFNPFAEGNCGRCGGIYDPHYSEVIGNIYENEELLK